jgi:hypothetical protein
MAYHRHPYVLRGVVLHLVPVVRLEAPGAAFPGEVHRVFQAGWRGPGGHPSRCWRWHTRLIRRRRHRTVAHSGCRGQEEGRGVEGAAKSRNCATPSLCPFLPSLPPIYPPSLKSTRIWTRRQTSSHCTTRSPRNPLSARSPSRCAFRIAPAHRFFPPSLLWCARRHSHATLRLRRPRFVRSRAGPVRHSGCPFMALGRAVGLLITFGLRLFVLYVY